MNKLLLIFCSALSLTSFAQQKKTVAVLDPICRDNSVQVFYQQMVRGAMESAVTASTEYEAYDRSAFDMIQKEQAFQRTGVVNDSTIKEMGKMAGVDYVLVSEVSAYEGYLSAIIKILNVTTGKYDKSVDDFTPLNPESVKGKCKEMASSLFGRVNTATQVVSTTKQKGTNSSSQHYKDSITWYTSRASAAVKSREYMQAVVYYDKVLNLAQKNNVLEDVADYQYNIAYCYFSSNNFPKAREYAIASIDTKTKLGQNNDQGRCYLLIGMCYAASKPYSTNDYPAALAAVLNKTVFWAAVDQFVKAKQVESIVADDADKLINVYSKYFPSKEECHRLPKYFSGSTFYVGGWIGETTHIR